MAEEINEIINVYAFFLGEDVTPLVFSWRGRRYENLKIISKWRTQNARGRPPHRCYMMSDGTNQYEIKLNANDLYWRLLKVYYD